MKRPPFASDAVPPGFADWWDLVPDACPDCRWPGEGFIAGAQSDGQRPASVPAAAQRFSFSLHCPVCPWWCSFTAWVADSAQ